MGRSDGRSDKDSSKQNPPQNSQQDSQGKTPPPPLPPKPSEPVNVVDGIPDRSPSPRPWKYILLFAIFAAWVGVLLLLYWWGKP